MNLDNVLTSESHHEDLQCGFCKQLTSLDSYLTIPCGHVFCKECCYERDSSGFPEACPCCGSKVTGLDDFSSRTLAYRILGKVRISCPHRDCCSWKGFYAQYPQHSKTAHSDNSAANLSESSLQDIAGDLVSMSQRHGYNSSGKNKLTIENQRLEFNDSSNSINDKTQQPGKESIEFNNSSNSLNDKKEEPSKQLLDLLRKEVKENSRGAFLEESKSLKKVKNRKQAKTTIAATGRKDVIVPPESSFKSEGNRRISKDAGTNRSRRLSDSGIISRNIANDGTKVIPNQSKRKSESDLSGTAQAFLIDIDSATSKLGESKNKIMKRRPSLPEHKSQFPPRRPVPNKNSKIPSSKQRRSPPPSNYKERPLSQSHHNFHISLPLNAEKDCTTSQSHHNMRFPLPPRQGNDESRNKQFLNPEISKNQSLTSIVKDGTNTSSTDSLDPAVVEKFRKKFTTLPNNSTIPCNEQPVRSEFYDTVQKNKKSREAKRGQDNNSEPTLRDIFRMRNDGERQSSVRQRIQELKQAGEISQSQGRKTKSKRMLRKSGSLPQATSPAEKSRILRKTKSHSYVVDNKFGRRGSNKAPSHNSEKIGKKQPHQRESVNSMRTDSTANSSFATPFEEKKEMDPDTEYTITCAEAHYQNKEYDNCITLCKDALSLDGRNALVSYFVFFFTLNLFC